MNVARIDENQSVWRALFRDGAAFLSLTGLALVASGGFALFLSFAGHFLPHDSAHIGFTAEQLSAIAPNLVKFMFHDRAAFGGALIAMGILYLWLAAYPLRNGQIWAWWTFCVSGLFGFGSFLAYIGYGYLDTWHGAATLALLPIFLCGVWRSRPSRIRRDIAFHPAAFWRRMKSSGIGFAFLAMYCLGLALAGASILAIGMTTVFVPQDIAFIQLCGLDIQNVSDHLIPVIAHDRAGFGGALLTTGVTLYLILVNANWSVSLRQTLELSGLAGFASTIGIHFYIGYTDLVHLLPAYLGAAIFVAGIILTRRDRLATADVSSQSGAKSSFRF